MDNQQERLALLGWAGGIIDGEGNISLVIQRVKHGNEKIRPIMKMSNTDPVLIDLFYTVLKREGIPVWRGSPNRKIRNVKHKPQEQVKVDGFKRFKYFAEVMRPFVRTKRAQLDIVMEYITYRESRPYHEPRTKREYELVELIRKLNKRGLESSEAIRSTPTGEDMVHSLDEN